MAYTPKTWVTGETIDASELNHIEQGIAEISANGAIGTANLADGAVTSVKIANNSITEDELADGAVVTAKIEDGAVTNAKIATAAVSGTQIADETITATNIADESLTEAKLDPTFAASLAKVDGSYELLTSGNAEQLVSTVGVENNAPYVFRTTGGAADVGDRMNLKAVVGGTVAWNQNLKEVNSTNWAATAVSTSVSIADGVATVTAGTQYTGLVNAAVNRPTFPNGRKMFYSVSVKLTTAVANAIKVKINNQDQKFAASSTAWQTISGFFTWDSTKAATFQILDFRASDRDAYQVKEPMLFDLTAMFGSAIADYAYTLESNTAGAGVAWLKSYGFFTKPYYPYAAANLQSVKTSAHITYGFNAYNPSTGKAKVVGGMVYQITGAYTALSLDGTSITPDVNGYFTPSANGELTVTGGNSTTTCIHLNWDGEKDGEYAPFEQHTYALDDVELRGILKLDASNNLYYDGDLYTPDGTVGRRYTEHSVVANNLMSNGADDVNSIYRVFYHCPDRAYTTNVVCDRFTQGSAGVPFTIGVRTNGDGIEFRIPYSAIGVSSSDTDNAKLTAAKAWFTNNVTKLVYEFATPTTESADAYTELQICNDFGTEEFVDAATRDFDMPVGNVAVYAPNLRAKLEMAPDSPDGGDGDYIVRQTNGTNEYVALSDNSIVSGLTTRCPACPTDTDGTFVLKATVSGGAVTYSWVSE